MLDQPWFQHEALEAYATAIHAKGAPLTTCFGFIDGTVRPDQQNTSVYVIMVIKECMA